MSPLSLALTRRLLPGAVMLLFAVPAVGGKAAADILPHRAIYNMSLLSASGGSGIATLSGRMMLEWADVCDGWTVQQRLLLRVRDKEGREFESYSSFVTWESKDGSRYRFDQQTWRDGRRIEELRGRAELTGTARAGMVYLTKPEARELPLPEGTMFPSEHTLLVIAKAAQGETYLTRIVFDGSTAEGPSEVAAFLGPLTTAPDDPVTGGRMPAWPIRLAFFPLGKETAEPDYEIGLLLQENGVARDLDLDYGDFKLHAELDEFEALPAPQC